MNNITDIVSRAIGKKVLDVTNKIAIDIHRGAVQGSPVDTGEFRGKWEVELATKPYESASISNSTTYGPELLAGHSGQAPAGWLDNVIESATQLRS